MLQTQIGYSSGVTSSQMRVHLYAKFPHLKEYTASFTAPKRMFKAPNNSLKASVRYNRLRDKSRVGDKFNSCV